MRFVFISGMAGHPWGGSEILWSESARLLRKKGHDVIAVVKDWKKPLPQHQILNSEGIEVIQFEDRYQGRIDHGIKSIFSLGRVGRTPFQIMKTIRSFRPNLICVSHGSATCGLFWMLESLTHRLPYVSVAQANSEHCWPSDNNLDPISTAYLGAERAFFVSKANWKLFEKQIATRLSNAEVVWNPCNVGLDNYQTWPVVDDQNPVWRLACVGRLEPAAKGQDLLFEVLSQRKWKERQATFSLFGTGRSAEGTKRLAKFFGVENQVVFKGHVQSVQDVWKDHHCLVLPSRYEGMALSLIECLLSGRPAIATNVAGAPEIIIDNETGFLSKHVDADGLDEAMDRAWSSRLDWKKMGLAAHVHLRSMLARDPIEAFSEKLELLALQLSTAASSGGL